MKKVNGSKINFLLPGFVAAFLVGGGWVVGLYGAMGLGRLCRRLGGWIILAVCH